MNHFLARFNVKMNNQNLSATPSWLGGLWGLFMLVGMVGNTLDSTQWKIRQKMVATLALVILIINWLDKVPFQEFTTRHGLKYFPAAFAP